MKNNFFPFFRPEKKNVALLCFKKIIINGMIESFQSAFDQLDCNLKGNNTNNKYRIGKSFGNIQSEKDIEERERVFDIEKQTDYTQ